MPRIKLTKMLSTCFRRLVRRHLLGRWLSRLWREGYAQGSQGVRRSLPHRRCRIEATQIHHRAVRALTLHQARVAAQKVFAAKLEGRDPARKARSSAGLWPTGWRTCWKPSSSNMSLRTAPPTRSLAPSPRNGKPWTGRSIHEITKRDVVEVISAIEQRGAPGTRQQDLEGD